MQDEVITIPHHVSREFVQAHPEWIFVFGNDLHEKGFFGQANSCYGEPNAYQIPTCYKQCKSSGYWHDSMFDEVKDYIDKAVAKIPRDGRPIIVLEKIGTGGSRMKEFAPKLYNYMKMKLDTIKYPNVKIDYEPK